MTFKKWSPKTPTNLAGFFFGYDCDSLALEKLTEFARTALPFFAKHSNAHLELRTKSVATQILEKTIALPNVVTAFSFTPQEISDALEKGVPSVKARIQAMRRLAEKGWKLGVRLDPIIDCIDFDQRYQSSLLISFQTYPSPPFIRFRLVPSVYRSLFSNAWKNYTRQNLSFPRNFQDVAVRLATHRKLKTNEFPPVRTFSTASTSGKTVSLPTS